MQILASLGDRYVGDLHLSRHCVMQLRSLIKNLLASGWKWQHYVYIVECPTCDCNFNIINTNDIGIRIKWYFHIDVRNIEANGIIFANNDIYIAIKFNKIFYWCKIMIWIVIGSSFLPVCIVVAVRVRPTLIQRVIRCLSTRLDRVNVTLKTFFWELRHFRIKKNWRSLKMSCLIRRTVSGLRFTTL